MSDAIRADILIDKKNLRAARIVSGAAPSHGDLEAGDALLRVDRFALTANNITYAAVGERMQYWAFFPATEGFFRVPVWGYGTVLASRADGLQAGERLFGYFPMSSHLTIEAGKISAGQLFDTAAHRQVLSPVYNQYRRLGHGGPADIAAENQDAVFIIFSTSFVIDDLLADQSFYGADQILIGSASSKTGYALGFLLSERKPRPRLVGLTSPGNVAFTRSMGCYDEVVPYTELERIDQRRKTAFIDMAGDGDVVKALHERLSGQLVLSLMVGATHWEAGRGAAAATPLPGPERTMFFAPTQMQKRIKDWGAEGYQARVDAAKGRFFRFVAPWYRGREARGPEATLKAYLDVLEGRPAPSEGITASLWP